MRALALLAILAVGSVAAQPAHVRVEASAGTVLVDGVVAGAPGDWLTVLPGARTVALVDDPRAFDPRRAEAALLVAPGDSASVALVLPRRVRVESLPIRALVVRVDGGRRDTLGRTPLTVDLGPGEALALEAARDGYVPTRRAVGADEAAVTLVLALGADVAPSVALLPTERSARTRTLIDVGIGAATLAAGALAVYTKFQADDAYDRYVDEASPDYADEAFREEAIRLDRRSAVALGAMQLGLGALAVRFVLR